MKIGILSAMDEEIQPFLSQLDNYSKEEYANNTFYLSEHSNHNLVIANSKIGKVFSSMTATLMIEKYGCEMILFTGVAGGVNPDLDIGDIVLANKLCQHDMDITAFGHPNGHCAGFGIYATPTKELLTLAKETANELNLKFIEGTIATGDQFIADSKKKDWIKSEFNADAIEMEGASVAVVCQTLDIPYLIIRSISDTAKEGAFMDFNEFLKVSAVESANFLKSILNKL